MTGTARPEHWCTFDGRAIRCESCGWTQVDESHWRPRSAWSEARRHGFPEVEHRCEACAVPDDFLIGEASSLHTGVAVWPRPDAARIQFRAHGQWMHMRVCDVCQVDWEAPQ